MNRFAYVYHLIIEDAIQTQTRLVQSVEAELLEIGFNMSEEARELNALESQERIIKDTQLYIYFFFPELTLKHSIWRLFATRKEPLLLAI